MNGGNTLENRLLHLLKISQKLTFGVGNDYSEPESNYWMATIIKSIPQKNKFVDLGACRQHVATLQSTECAECLVSTNLVAIANSRSRIFINMRAHTVGRCTAVCA